MIVENYLKKIQKTESIFPMDSFPKRDDLGKIYTEEQIENVEQAYRRIMIDFDGTINKYSNGWNDGKIDEEEPFEDAKESIDKLKSLGFEIVIFTSRASKTHNINPSSKELIQKIKEWLDKYNIYYDFITAEKLPALIYIDDKGFRFTGNWKYVMKEIPKLLNIGKL